MYLSNLGQPGRLALSFRRVFGLAVVVCGALGVSLPAHAVTATITYTDGASEGFNDATLGTQRREAFEAAVEEWTTRLEGTVPIAISASMDPLAISGNSAVLGSAGPTYVVSGFSGAPSSTVQYPAALANQLAGTDLGPSYSDITCKFNSDIDDSTKWPTPWYYGLDANPGSKRDFYTVVLHELGHGLGFMSRISSSGVQAGGSTPYTFDLFKVNGSGSGATNAQSMTDAQRAALEISNSLYFNGPNATPANGGTNPRLYAPSTYESGSSGSHLNQDTYQSTDHRLMCPVYSSAIHDPGTVALGIFEDMGWTLLEPNVAPVASNLSQIVNPGSAKSIQLRASDSDGDALTYTIVSNPQHGTVSLGSGGVVTYTSIASFTGTDSFTFKANDGQADSNTATVTLVANAAPALVDLTVEGATSGSGEINQPIDIVLRATDADGASNIRMVYVTFNKLLSNSGGAALSYDSATNIMSLRSDDGKTILTGAAPGSSATPISNSYVTLDFANSSAVKNGNQLTVTFSVTPLQPFLGDKKLWGKVRDGNGLSAGDTQLATWSVTAPATAIRAVPSSFTTVLKETETYRNLVLPVSNPDNLPLTYTIVTPPTHGTLGTVLTGGIVRYTKKASFTGLDTFTFKVNDSLGDSVIATATVKYNGAPILQSLTVNGASSGSSTVGSALELKLTIREDDGVDTLRTVYLTFNRFLSNSNGIVLMYEPTTNKMSLRSNDGKTLLGGTPVTGGLIENDYGTLDLSQSKVEKSGTSMVLTFHVTPKSPFIGAKNLYAKAKDSGSLTDGDDLMATWTVNAAASGLQTAIKSSAQSF